MTLLSELHYSFCSFQVNKINFPMRVHDIEVFCFSATLRTVENCLKTIFPTQCLSFATFANFPKYQYLEGGGGRGGIFNIYNLYLYRREPIRSIKMYSHAQCTMQERSVCCRVVPCLAHMELGSGPLLPEHLPPSLSAWGNGDSVYWQP
jgi:hypothetical protein